MAGSEVFDLTERQLEQYCGIAEGHKLYSQISLARAENEVSNKSEKSKRWKFGFVTYFSYIF